MNKKIIKLSLILIILIIILSIFSCNNDDKIVEKNNSVLIEGSGNGVKHINLNKGVYMFTANYYGTYNFFVSIQKSDGKEVTPLFNIISKTEHYNGTQMFSVNQKGKYYIKVISKGNWEITIQ